MKIADIKGLKISYENFLTAVRNNNIKTGSYSCPSCKKDIEAMVPENDEIFDSLSTCPHCGEIFMKVVHSDKIIISSTDGKTEPQEFPVKKTNEPNTSKNEVLELKWTAQDVIQRMKDLGDDRFITFGDACDILSIVAQQYDANLGVNWDTIDDATNEFFDEQGA